MDNVIKACMLCEQNIATRNELCEECASIVRVSIEMWRDSHREDVE